MTFWGSVTLLSTGHRFELYLAKSFRNPRSIMSFNWQQVLTTKVSVLPMAFAIAGMGWGVTLANPASAASFSFSVNEFTGDDTKVDFLVEDITGGVRISASINTSGTNVAGDISGIWLNLADDAIAGSLAITGADITKAVQQANGVGDLGGGVNFNGGGNTNTLFDVGLKIGRNGNDDIEQTSFEVLGQNLSIADFAEQMFAVRIKSSDGDEGSSKLIGIGGPPNQSRDWHECGQGDNPIPCVTEPSEAAEPTITPLTQVPPGHQKRNRSNRR
jgi:hypothetical protein